MAFRLMSFLGCATAFLAVTTAQGNEFYQSEGGIGSSSAIENAEKINQSEQSIAKNFEMFGLNAQQNYNGEIQVAGKKCKLKGSGVEHCYQIYGKAAISDVKLKIINFSFYNGKLFSISGSSSNSNFFRVYEAFEAKYGKPSKAKVEIWQNRIGSKFDNNTNSWIFKDGILKIESIGYSIDEMKFTFESIANAPERDPPKLNF